MVSDDKGDFGYAPLLDAMYAALKDLLADGLVSEEEFHGGVIRTVGRSNAEFGVPLADGGAGSRA
jgi:salicylate 1-O-methyltransferase